MSRPSDSDIPKDIDLDAQETQEWLQALQSVLAEAGPERARFLLSRLSAAAQQWGVNWRDARNTPYVNTIRPEQEPPFPGGSDAQAIEERIASIMRWNALAMVVRANRAYGELGGTSPASPRRRTCSRSASITSSVRAMRSSPVTWSTSSRTPRPASMRALSRRRLERRGPGLLSPRDRSQARGAAGFVVLSASLADAAFLAVPDRLHGHRSHQCHLPGALPALHGASRPAAGSGRKVWGVFGDGEMDEPESLAALSLASREKLDNLIFVVNCNLQRLDGPVRGNGHIVDELETLFAGAGWNVIKLLWGSDWDGLFARDRTANWSMP
jgi:pyruvate dehydrogenase E1 component